MNIEGESWRDVTMGEGRTPIISFDKDVMVKMGLHDADSFFLKIEGAAALVAHMKEIRRQNAFRIPAEMPVWLLLLIAQELASNAKFYVPEGTSPKKISMIEAFGAKAVVVPGTRDHCADVCREKVVTEGAYYANHVFNPFFYEGTKTYIYETYEQLKRVPENIFIELGNGTLFIGAVLALEHLLASGVISHFPQVIAIQASGCAPLSLKLVEKKQLDHLAEITPVPTLAEGIAIGKPAKSRGDRGHD